MKAKYTEEHRRRHREVGARIREARRQENILQAEIATLLGITDRTMQKIEKGEVDPWRYVEQIAPIVNKDAAWLWTGQDPEGVKLGPEIRKIERRLSSQEKMLDEILSLLKNGSSGST